MQVEREDETKMKEVKRGWREYREDEEIKRQKG